MLSYCRLTPEPEVTTVSNSSTSSHILLSINIHFLSEQYLSGTLFLKPASTQIPSPHSRRSSVTNPERCTPPPIVVIRESDLTITKLELELELAGFLCGRPCDMELVTRQYERPGHQQTLLQTFTEDVFIFSLLVYIAH